MYYWEANSIKCDQHVIVMYNLDLFILFLKDWVIGIVNKEDGNIYSTEIFEQQDKIFA